MIGNRYAGNIRYIFLTRYYKYANNTIKIETTFNFFKQLIEHEHADAQRYVLLY